MTFTLSLFAFLSWWTVIAMALPPSPGATQKYVQEQAVVSSHRNMLLASLYFHNQVHRRRHLQSFPTDCDVAYLTLFNDPTLFEAAETWLSNLEASVASPNPDDCEITDGTSTNCDFSGEVTGTQEFLDACTRAGGVPQSLEIDISCTYILSGQLSSLNMYFPSLWDCMPPNCEDEFEAALALIVEELEADLVLSFSEIGVTSICEAETDFPQATAGEVPASGGVGTSPTTPGSNFPPVAPQETVAPGGSGTSPTTPGSNFPPVAPEETVAPGGSGTSPSTPGSNFPPAVPEETLGPGGSGASPSTPGSNFPPVAPEEAIAPNDPLPTTSGTGENNDSPNTANAVSERDASSALPVTDVMTTTIHMVLTLICGTLFTL
ncbi:hypothetical protein IV203_017380 [Nitzschia inconspicua]|uniref:Uncharacterized protein n=1 Tax=Nitzschia inconspicua TaxID=303405 RepID=A0A9K3KT08_9STRA|nr:hypothetical protein IV203_017567 [Nitzschia inconspicua]KAG7348675.1 hypothetical protein IV203_017380 [Nitzschia inconspicua]